MSGSHTISALYVHVPFCLGKCRYCDFYSLPIDLSLAGRYVAAAGRQLERLANQLSRPLKTLFIGGGTPSALGANLLARLIEPLQPCLSADTEFSIEANPGALDIDTLAAMVAGGVNRVSLGVQSFDDEELAMLGRPHTAREARGVIDAITAAGIDNWSLDLIYALPGQSLQRWQQTLQEALSCQPSHLSCYALSFEEGTAFHEAMASGELDEMSDEPQRRCYERACELVGEAGFVHYELSNFARPGRECRHNLTYWRNEPYLGIGPAAASYVDGERRTNHPDLMAWLEAVEADDAPPACTERLTGPMAMAETLMLGLRLIEGVDRGAFARRFGMDVLDALPETVARYRQQDLLEVTGRHLRLAPRARFVSDSILADFVAEARAAR